MLKRNFWSKFFGLAIIVAFAGINLTPVYADVPIRTITGNFSGAGQTIAINGLNGQSTCTTTISGTFSATLTFEQSADNTTYTTNSLTSVLGGSSSGTTTSAGVFYSPLGTVQIFRVRVSAYTSGNGTINITCSSAAPLSVGASGGGSVTQGTSPWVISGTVTPTFPYGMTQSQTASTTSGAGALCAYFSAAPTLTNGQVNPLACDVSGNLRNVNIGWGGATLAAATAPGTASSGNVITVQGNASNVPLPVSGSVTVSNFPTPSPLGQALSSASIPVVPASDWIGKVSTNQTTPGTTDLVHSIEMPSSGSIAGTTPVNSSAVETGHVIKASAGNLYDFNVTSGASAGEVLLFNSTTVPSAGAVTPVKCYNIAANSTLGANFNPPLNFSTGISIAFSTATTCFTQTNSATAFISGDAQ
jgi:hypothetical protein